MRPSPVILSIVFAAALAEAALAQSTNSATKHNNNTYGSPLDTIMSTRLWTDVAPAKDFVQESHPDPKSLDYTPLTGTDPERAKPRDKANIAALQAELDRDLTTNARKGNVTPKPTKTAAKTRRTAAKKVEPAQSN